MWVGPGSTPGLSRLTTDCSTWPSASSASTARLMTRALPGRKPEVSTSMTAHPDSGSVAGRPQGITGMSGMNAGFHVEPTSPGRCAPCRAVFAQRGRPAALEKSAELAIALQRGQPAALGKSAELAIALQRVRPAALEKSAELAIALKLPG